MVRKKERQKRENTGTTVSHPRTLISSATPLSGGEYFKQTITRFFQGRNPRKIQKIEKVISIDRDLLTIKCKQVEKGREVCRSL